MKKTPLYDQHISLKGRMVDFAGYSMPVSYASIKDEYYAVREGCGLFDISHMAPILFKSEAVDDTLALLEQVTCKQVNTLEKGQGQYNALVNEKGGIVDDITVYNIDGDRYAVIANASNREKVLQYLNRVNDSLGERVTITEVKDYVLMALQGPESETVLGQVMKAMGIEVPPIYYYEIAELNTPGAFPSLLSRTGYTGEDGFEILLPIDSGIEAWQKLIEAGALPAGLAARDILRLEMFYPLYGNELTEEMTPYEGGIGWLVNLEKDFNGRAEIEKSKAELTHRVRGFILHDEGVPRTGYKVLNEEGNEVGEVTSGGFSFTWNKGFGMAKLAKDYTSKGTRLFVDIRKQKKAIEVLAKSPYQGSIKRRP